MVSFELQIAVTLCTLVLTSHANYSKIGSNCNNPGSGQLQKTSETLACGKTNYTDVPCGHIYLCASVLHGLCHSDTEGLYVYISVRVCTVWFMPLSH